MSRKKAIEKYDSEKVKKALFETITLDGDKKRLLKELGEEILPKYLKGSLKEQKEIEKRLQDKSLALLRIFESESHVNLMESFTESYRMTAKEMVSKMIDEYQCTNEAEKAIAGTITNAYIRILDNSRRLNNELECRDISHNRNTYISMLSKQVDRANRQFLSALLTLKQLKAPSIEMNVRATNAFVSQNQQVNFPNNEIIEPQ